MLPARGRGERRKHRSKDAGAWSLRFHRPEEKARLRAVPVAGRKRFGLPSRVTNRDGEVMHLWCARDVPVPPRRGHVTGHGGATATVRTVRDDSPVDDFVRRTDVKPRYGSIDQHLLLEVLRKHVRNRGVLNLLGRPQARSGRHSSPART